MSSDLRAPVFAEPAAWVQLDNTASPAGKDSESALSKGVFRVLDRFVSSVQSIWWRVLLLSSATCDQSPRPTCNDLFLLRVGGWSTGRMLARRNSP